MDQVKATRYRLHDVAYAYIITLTQSRLHGVCYMDQVKATRYRANLKDWDAQRYNSWVQKGISAEKRLEQKVCMLIYTYVHAYVCMYMYVSMHAWVQKGISAEKRLEQQVCMLVYTYVHVYVYVYVRAHNACVGSERHQCGEENYAANLNI